MIPEIGRGAFVATLTLAIMAIVAACDGDTGAKLPSPTPALPGSVVTSGYPLSHVPANAIRSAESNPIIVVARVVAIGSPGTYSLPDLGKMQFTPIELIVTGALRGPVVTGDQLTLRILGNSTGDRVFAEDLAPPVAAFEVGAEFILFTQEAVPFDGLSAVTPNHAYRVKNGRAVDAFEGHHSIDVTQFLDDLRARLDL